MEKSQKKTSQRTRERRNLDAGMGKVEMASRSAKKKKNNDITTWIFRNCKGRKKERRKRKRMKIEVEKESSKYKLA